MLVGVLEEEADIPHIVGGKDVLEGWHAGKTDAIFHLPEGLSGFVVADADNVAAGVLLPELRCVRIHACGKGNVVARDAVAGGALQRIDHGSIFIHIFAGAEGGLLHLAVNAGVEGDLYDLGLEGEGFVRGGDWRRAVFEVDERADEEDYEGEDEAKNELQDAGARCRFGSGRCHGAIPLRLL